MEGEGKEGKEVRIRIFKTVLLTGTLGTSLILYSNWDVA